MFDSRTYRHSNRHRRSSAFASSRFIGLERDGRGDPHTPPPLFNLFKETCHVLRMELASFAVVSAQLSYVTF